MKADGLLGCLINKLIDMKRIAFILLFLSSLSVYGQETWNTCSQTVTVIPQPSYDSTFVLSAPSRADLAKGMASWTPATASGIDDVLAEAQTFTADRSINIGGSAFSIGDGTHDFIFFSPDNLGYQFGDTNGESGNGVSYIGIDANGYNFTTMLNNNSYIIIDGGNHSMDLGDIDGWGNNTYVAIEDDINAVRINAAKVVLVTSAPPASASATGISGQIAWDANYIYMCVATNTWKRVSISTW